jgi:hypothetical protein
MVFEQLKNSVLGFGIFVIILAVMAQVLGVVKGTQTVNSAEYNITGSGMESLQTFSDFNPVIVIFIILGIILLLVGAFMGSRQQ